MIPQLSATEVSAWLADSSREQPVLLDVREPWEYATCNITGSQLIPLQTLPTHAAGLPKDRDIVVICHHGNRSQTAAAWLARNGFDRVSNLRGGVAAWADEVDPAMARY